MCAKSLKIQQNVNIKVQCIWFPNILAWNNPQLLTCCWNQLTDHFLFCYYSPLSLSLPFLSITPPLPSLCPCFLSHSILSLSLSLSLSAPSFSIPLTQHFVSLYSSFSFSQSTPSLFLSLSPPLLSLCLFFLSFSTPLSLCPFSLSLHSLSLWPFFLLPSFWSMFSFPSFLTKIISKWNKDKINKIFFVHHTMSVFCHLPSPLLFYLFQILC